LSVWSTFYGLLAQATTQPTTRAADRPFLVGLFDSPMGLMLALVVIMYVFMIRGNKNKEKQREQMLNAIKKGDRVQTIGGMLGNVVDVRDDSIQVKVDESSNVKIWFVRSAIQKIRGDEKAEKK
jgi:preprotein translocase subunit YajC